MYSQSEPPLVTQGTYSLHSIIQKSPISNIKVSIQTDSDIILGTNNYLNLEILKQLLQGLILKRMCIKSTAGSENIISLYLPWSKDRTLVIRIRSSVNLPIELIFIGVWDRCKKR